ncbi:MAG: LuxR family transcriptional regulator [Microvirga sp.]|nr:LuxR family transcriptional regulator [Microvirga sp.]
MFRDTFSAAMEQVELADSTEELQRAVVGLLEPYGLKHAVYHAIRLPGAAEENPVVIFTYPEDWISYYRLQRYYRIDPVVLRAVNGVLPVDWNSIEITPGVVRKLFAEASDAGVGTRGLTFPIRGAHGDVAIFTVTTTLPDADWAHLKSVYMRDMQLLGNFIHNRIATLRGWSNAPSTPLSRRERECLQWAAAGETIAGTAEKLRLSERVVRGYLDSARHKLACLTKTQAVARGLSAGIIAPP